MTFFIYTKYFPNQPSSIVSIRLTVLNFKSSKFNGSANRLEEEKDFSYFRSFCQKLPVQPIQFLNPSLTAFFLKIFFLLAKTSLLALPPPRAITPLPCHMFLFLLLLSFRQSFLLYSPWPNIWRLSPSRSLKPS